MEKTCKINDCGKKLKSRFYCSKHTEQIRRHGKVIKTKYDKRGVTIYGQIALLPLGVNAKDGYAIIDSNNSWLEKYNWYMSNGYVVGRINNKDIRLHRYLMKTKKGKVVDHINMNPLDNRIVNLRNCTYAENNWNKGPHKNNKLGCKGIQIDKQRNKYRAHLKTNGKMWRSKRYNNIEDAIECYDAKVKKLRGKFGYIEGSDKMRLQRI